MAQKWDVDVTLNLQGRLRRSARDWQIEISVMVDNLEGFGLAATELAGYTSVTGVTLGNAGAPDVVDFELKTRGTWTPLVLRVHASGLLVLGDR